MKKDELREALESTYSRLLGRRENNIKVWESGYQDAIESVFPSECWWNVTGCDIFMHLFENRDPLLTLEQIVKGYKMEG